MSEKGDQLFERALYAHELATASSDEWAKLENQTLVEVALEAYATGLYREWIRVDHPDRWHDDVEWSAR